MLEVLWGILALCALAATAAMVYFLISARETSQKLGRTLDDLNHELPGLISSIRHAADEGRLAAAGIRGAAERLQHGYAPGMEGLESLLSAGGAFSNTAAMLGGLIKGARVVAGLFGRGRERNGAKHPS